MMSFFTNNFREEYEIEYIRYKDNNIYIYIYYIKDK